jgi:hypothetical protein
LNNSGLSTTSPLSVQIQNMPSITDMSRSYIITTILKGYLSGNSYIGNVKVSTNTTFTSANVIIPKYTNTIADMNTLVSAVTSNGYIMQQLAYFYLDSSSVIFSNVSSFQ